MKSREKNRVINPSVWQPHLGAFTSRYITDDISPGRKFSIWNEVDDGPDKFTQKSGQHKPFVQSVAKGIARKPSVTLGGGAFMTLENPTKVKALMMCVRATDKASSTLVKETFRTVQKKRAKPRKIPGASVALSFTDTEVTATFSPKLWGGLSVDGGDLGVGQTVTTQRNGHVSIIYINFSKPINVSSIGSVKKDSKPFDVGELAFWADTPSLDEIRSYEWHLAGKFKTSLVSSHIYKNSPSMPNTRSFQASKQIGDAKQLVKRVNNGKPGEIFHVAPGLYEITEPLRLKPMCRIVGVSGSTRIRPLKSSSKWKQTFNDVMAPKIPEKYDDYLVRAVPAGKGMIGNIGLFGLHMTGVTLHGAVYLPRAHYSQMERCDFINFGWSGVRDNYSHGTTISHCNFNSAGKRPGVESGGAYMGHMVHGPRFYNNVVENAVPGIMQGNPRYRNHVGFKTHGAVNIHIKNSEFHSNTFAIECAHQRVDVGHVVENCIINGAISLPKHRNTPVTAKNVIRKPNGDIEVVGGRLCWHIKQSYFQTTYGLEMPRNGVLLQQCVIADKRKDVQGNFACQYDPKADKQKGFVAFFDTRAQINRGLFNNYKVGSLNVFVENCEITCAKDVETDSGEVAVFHQPRNMTEAENKTWRVKNTIFDFTHRAMPMFRNAESRDIHLHNCSLTGVTDGRLLTVREGSGARGAKGADGFSVGLNGRWTVKGFNLELTK